MLLLEVLKWCGFWYLVQLFIFLFCIANPQGSKRYALSHDTQWQPLLKLPHHVSPFIYTGRLTAFPGLFIYQYTLLGLSPSFSLCPQILLATSSLFWIGVCFFFVLPFSLRHLHFFTQSIDFSVFGLLTLLKSFGTLSSENICIGELAVTWFPPRSQYKG